MCLLVISAISFPVRSFSKSILLIISNMYNLRPWLCSPGKLSSLSYQLTKWYASFKTHSTDPPSFLRTYTASLFIATTTVPNTQPGAQNWDIIQINKQTPSFPDSWYLGVSKKLIFPTLDLVVNLVILLCLSLLSQMTVCPWIHQDMKICMFTWHFPGTFTYNLCLKCSRMEFHILLVFFIIPFFNLKLVYIKD